ncbi:hypothetical protein OKW40_006065 [Paraburkholderia sp. RAU6.4a]
MTRDSLRQRVDDEARADRLWLEQCGRGNRVIDEVHDAALTAHVTDTLQVGNLRARIRDGFDEHHARIRPDCVLHVVDVARVDGRDFDAECPQRAEQTVGVAEHVTARHEMIARAQQRQERRGDAGHACAEADRADAFFEAGDLALERGGGGRALPCVIEAAFLRALEHADQVLDALETILHGRMNWLTQGTVLGARNSVAVNDASGETLLVHSFSAFLDRLLPTDYHL